MIFSYFSMFTDITPEGDEYKDSVIGEEKIRCISQEVKTSATVDSTLETESSKFSETSLQPRENLEGVFCGSK